jgi:hypothetical protein
MIGSAPAGSDNVLGVLIRACIIAQVEAGRIEGWISHDSLFPGYNGVNAA